jgi:hypothetical protein
MAAGRVTLADVCAPPDTAMLAPCDEAETAFAIERMRRALLRQRKRCARSGSGRSAAKKNDAALAQLRRLQNPQIAAYRCGDAIVLSEPFNGIPSAVARAPRSVAHEALTALMRQSPPESLEDALAAYGEAALTAAARGGISIAIVPEGQPFASFSSSVARCAPGIDEWSAPPSGLFVVEERRILLRQHALRMTAAHEFAHALDALLARKKRSYFSYESEELRYYFATATGFVNEYAASSLDEYFAESMRAYVEVNDEHCAWLPLTRQDLYLRDPRMFALIERLFRSGFAAVKRRGAVRPNHR